MRSDMAPNLSGVRLSFLMRSGFALNEVGGLLCLGRGRNKQPRIGLEPCNPRLGFRRFPSDPCGQLSSVILWRAAARAKFRSFASAYRQVPNYSGHSQGGDWCL